MAYDGSLIFDTKVDGSGFDGVAKIAGVAAIAISAAFAGAATAAIAVGSSFEEGMDKVSAISGATAADMERLTAKAEEMGAKTKFTATESAEALQYMAQAGWKTSQMLDGIDGVMSLAAASGESLASVSDIVTDAMTAFGLQAKEAGHFSDVLAMAASASNTDVAKMGATFKYVAPLAGAMKYSIEDTAVAIGLMANAGIKGEMAGTALRQMFTRLANPPKDAAEALDALKISITNTDGSIKPLSTTLLDLREKFSGLSDSEKTAMASSLAGQEAMSGLLSIVNASASDFENLTAQINNADGSAEEMAATMQDNLKGQLTILGSSLEAVGIAAYGKFQEPMKTAVQSAIGGLNNLTSSLKSGRLSESMDKIANSFAYCAAEAASFVTEKALPTLIDGFAWFADNGRSVATVIGVVGGAIGGYTIATNIATIATKLFTGAFVVSPIGLVAGAIAALTVGVIAFSNASTEGERQIALFNDEMDRAKEAGEQIISASEGEISSLERKAKTYEELRLKVNKTAEEEAMLQSVAEDLQAVLPEGTSLINDQTGAYMALGGSIDNVIAKMRAQALMNSLQPAYEAALGKLDEMEKKKSDMANQDFFSMDSADLLKFNSEMSGVNTVLGESQKVVDNYVARMEDILKGGDGKIKSPEFTSITGALDTRYAGYADSAMGILKTDTAVTDGLGDNLEKQLSAEEKATSEKKKSFDENVAIMDKKRAIGQMSDAEYYAELSKMLKDAKADEMGIYNDYYAEIYSYQKSANKTSLSAAKLSAKELAKVQEDIFKDWSGSVSTLVDETEKGFNEIAKKRESLQSKLESYGGLFERKKVSKDSDETEVALNDLNKTAQKLEEYGAALEALKAAGASSAFLSEVTAMGVDDGLDFAKALTSKSQNELENYLKSWQKNKDIAAKIAEEFYKDEVDSLQINFVDKFNSLLEVMPKNLTAIGTDTMQGFIDGLNSKLSEVTKLSSYIAEEVAKAFAKPIEINSPSKVFKRFGEYTMEGYGIGLEGGSDSVMGIAKAQGNKVISAFGSTDVSKSVSFDVGDIPPEFYGLGQTSAEQFSIGFTEKMKLLLSNVKNVVDVTMAGLTPRLAVAGAAAAAGNTTKIELTQINNSPKAIGEYEANKGLRELEQRLARRWW